MARFGAYVKMCRALDVDVLPTMTGGTPDAVHPLAQLQPRQLTAQVRSPVAVLRLDRMLLDKLLAIDGAGDIEEVKVSEIETKVVGSVGSTWRPVRSVHSSTAKGDRFAPSPHPTEKRWPLPESLT